MLSFLRSLADKTDPTTSLKHVAYMVGIACACVWLSIGLFLKNGLDGNWVASFGLFLTAITGAKVWGDKPSPTQQPDVDGPKS